ncbi:ABC transporter ATP-binding protein [Cellulosimicrobium cellulans]|uniref:ABC transporter ATP-binding protein n=1 Tax=Cellulosimicrobium cellulans TaxID=1710 RepID=UPI001EDC7908|nr:ABC transporter ATP-binding protein [Cellulosimicrobium cellulans]
MTMIEVVGAGKSYGARTIWSGLTLSVESGSMMGLVGSSGSGKTTLLNCLGLLDRVDVGTITVDGRDVTALGARDRRLFRRDQLGYLFQNYALIDNETVAANLDVAFPGRGARRSERAALREEALDRVGLGGYGASMVYELSGGEQQRVAVARLLIKRPRVVLADEPTGALDETNADAIVALLRGFADDGCTVVVATHNPRVEGACDAVLELGASTQNVARTLLGSKGDVAS